MTRHTKPINTAKQSVPELQKQHSYTLNSNLKKLDSFKLLEPNWNENGAVSFNTAFIDHVKTIITQLPVQPQIFPTGRNSIQLEYDKPNGDSVELEIYADGLIESVQFLKTSTVESNISEADLPAHIQTFYVD